MSSETSVGTTNNSSLTIQFLGRRSICGSTSTKTRRMILLLEDLDGLCRFQKITLMNRFITVMEEFSSRASFFSWVFNISRFIVTVGSLIVPALLSIQYTGSTNTGTDVSLQIYWTTWTLSLMVTISNGILTLFKLDKKYYFLNTVLEQLQSEMWQYIHLTGRYAGKYCPGKLATHDNQFIFFCHNMEKIKLKQVEEEYFKLIESKENAPTAQPADTAQGAQSNQTIAGLFTPTPEQQKLLQHKQELAQALLETSPPDTQAIPILRMPTPPDQSVLFQLETLPNLVEHASLGREAPKDAEEETATQQNIQGRNTVRPSIKVSVQ
jgi:hypothetical protein